MQIDKKFLSEQIKIAREEEAAALEKTYFMRGVIALAELLLVRMESASEVCSTENGSADGKGQKS